MAVGGLVMALALVVAGDARYTVLTTLDPLAFSQMQQAWLVVALGAVLVLAGTLILQLAPGREAQVTSST